MCFWKIGSTVPSYSCPLCIINSIVFPPKKKPFPLLRLPAIPLRLITKMMNAEEILHLSMCSYRLELFLRASKHKMNYFSVHVNNRHMTFLSKVPDSLKLSFKIGVGNKEVNSVDKMGMLCESLQEEDGTIRFNQEFPPDEMLEIYRRIISLYSPSLIKWIFYFKTPSMDSVCRYLVENLTAMDNYDMTTYHRFVFLYGSLTREFLTEMMDRIPVTASMAVTAGIPTDFKHSKAFKYKTVEYKEARWATLDDLKSVKNECFVNLKSSNFDCKDLNEFLKYWVECDEAILTRLTLKLKEGTVIDETVLTDQLTILLYYYRDMPHFFLKMKKISNEKLVVGHLGFKKDKTVEFNVWPTDKWSGIFEMLELLEKVKELEKELLRMDGEDEPNNYKEIREKNTRRREIEKEVEQLRRQIDELNDAGLILQYPV
ncbi:hypothetical protein GCK72_004697 [Caenorhabditis remanei]|uniref:F-box domain-containing protein n=1 Tax=Caenorhabditis remanei TaxID=31234 RepID=A0A6A5HC46_CAERE|nr:hypothetical protein GCK72_004697 [Caenorhabditis remanei]KAF1764747.1 hypothetical protein GCK72_004697 [Caenorhabditis remanei]